MMLYADVLLLKYNNQIHKHTYFTTAYRSDQVIADSLTIVSLVILQIATDSPNLKELIMQVLIMPLSMCNHFMRYANLLKFIFCVFVMVNLKRAEIRMLYEIILTKETRFNQQMILLLH